MPPARHVSRSTAFRRKFRERIMWIEHFVENGQEIVVVDGSVRYLVDRERQELWRLSGPASVLPLEQQQHGRTPDGGVELLERYCADDGESVVVDASPGWLREIGVK
jgi:hypothetical protein